MLGSAFEESFGSWYHGVPRSVSGLCSASAGSRFIPARCFKEENGEKR